MLSLTNVCKTFSKGSINERVALDHVSLSLGEGEFLVIIGGNGAGKSTLLNCIAGVFEPDEGNILLDEQDITYQPEHRRSRRIGRVFQDPMRGTAFDMTIEENLSIAYGKGKPRGLRRGITRADSELFREKLKLLELGLEDRLHQKVGLLSGGQRQALTLLMATIVKPRLLLLDEHAAALDPSIAGRVMALTREIVERERICTMMVTHNMRAALQYGSRTVMMHEGRIILDISGKEREEMTVEGLIEQFGRRSGEALDNDRMLLG